MLKMLKYIFTNILFFGITVSLLGQEAKPKRSQSIALGVDLYPLAVHAFDDCRTGLNISGRYGLKDKVFVTAEMGYENVDYSNTETITNDQDIEVIAYDYAHKSDGTFLRAGLDYNLFNVDEPGNNDYVGVGFRYGYALQNQESPAFTLGNGYWDDYHGDSFSGTVSSHWLEVIFGLRTELFKNFYAGWSIRGKMLIHSEHSGVMDPYSIPGFGKTNNRLSVGFTYSLEYQIPFGKRRTAEIKK